MARGDILLVGLPESDRQEEKEDCPAIAVQKDVAASPMLIILPVTSQSEVR